MLILLAKQKNTIVIIRAQNLAFACSYATNSELQWTWHLSLTFAKFLTGTKIIFYVFLWWIRKKYYFSINKYDIAIFIILLFVIQYFLSNRKTQSGWLLFHEQS